MTDAPRRRCRVFAAIDASGPRDRSVLSRLLGEVRACGADAIVVEVDRGDDGPSGWLQDVVEEAGTLDVVFAPASIGALRGCATLKAQAWKLHPSLITHLSLVEELAAEGRPIFAGIAGCTRADLEEAVARLPQGTTLVHTLLSTARGPEVLDVAHMGALRRYGRPVGYADCSGEVHAGLTAVALGARVVEKPLTLERPSRVAGPPAGLLPHEFLSFVARVRELEDALDGDGMREPCPEELDDLDGRRVSVVAAVPIPIGTTIERAMLAFERHSSGLAPRLVSVIEGRRALYDLPAGAPLTFGVIEP